MCSQRVYLCQPLFIIICKACDKCNRFVNNNAPMQKTIIIVKPGESEVMREEVDGKMGLLKGKKLEILLGISESFKSIFLLYLTINKNLIQHQNSIILKFSYE